MKKTSLKVKEKTEDKSKDAKVIRELDKQLVGYISGKLKKFDIKALGISDDLHELGGTDLQRKVWRELLRIPYGKVVTYGELAKRVGKPKAVRAVANAVAKNKLHILIPCHRVLPSQPFKGGRLVTGNYAGGPEVKKLLLEMEGVF